jgi:hypothetical protein
LQEQLVTGILFFHDYCAIKYCYGLNLRTSSHLE